MLIKPGESNFLLGKAFVELSHEMTHKKKGDWVELRDNPPKPSATEHGVRGFALGFTAGSLASGVAAPFIRAAHKTPFEDLYEPASDEKLSKEQVHSRKKLLALAIVGAPGLALGTLVGVVCAAGGAIAGAVKKIGYNMSQNGQKGQKNNFS
jgi:hypothetical protein